MKSKKLKIFLSVLCLVLAFVIGFFASHITSLFGANNNFEIITGTAVDSDEIFGQPPFDTSGGNNHFISYAGNQDKDLIEMIFDFDVMCKGNNIKEITYTANYAKFSINDTYYKDIKINGRDRENGVGKICSSFTVDYDNQPKWGECEDSTHPVNLLISVKSTDSDNVGSLMLDEEIDKYWNYTMNKSAGREYDKDFDIKKYSVKNSLEYLYEEMFYGTNVEVEVTYSDGSVESKKIEISYDPKKSSYKTFKPYVTYNID